MMDNVRSAAARVAAIHSTIHGPKAAPAEHNEASTPDGLRAAFTQALAGAGSPMGTTPMGTMTLGTMLGMPQPGFSQLGNTGWAGAYPATGLTPVAGARRTGPPVGFEGFRNGDLPLTMLAPVSGSNAYLAAPAAAAFEHMRADAARSGVSLSIIDGYRHYDDQVRLASELGLYKDGGKAAVPGTSEHGWGRAVDLDLDDRSVSWLRANAWKYGFVEAVPREPWHWEFHPAG